ncbi:peptidase family U32 [Lactococcus chungangensis CAU 28 = DSM 22330]|uniref:Collagenase-like protease, PrtC family n=1 Tax=Pseudolactococcus chungangensis CAU 28 = DSM 22330 TaxID=1122154 RepID=A0A1K2H5Y7_9LACT|nr:peptidase U32 family protein [Lactococcus chungangensis]NCB80884.1 U32 family peptidase [Bacilli bacterium]PCS04550.1 peptidase family U32 [Lactococcus chungangensis CAU 28 = DSM 22330]SFZ71471.1 Collagenase-like protease, PrtC family [Lactococcus chungangensis CAU 28 = DSM 22330]
MTKKIKITATAENFEQAKALLDLGIDTLYIGESEYALRLPNTFTWNEIRDITELAHAVGAQVTVAVNAIMHPEKMAAIKPYLDFLQTIKVDQIAVGDTGVIFVLNRDKYQLPYIYDASTMVTSSRQVNFWGQQGAIGAVLSRELPKEELIRMAENLDIFGEILVYGATIIHQSKRPLLENYYNFIKTDEEKSKARNLFLSEPKDETTHYSIYEDSHGTHIFASDDVDMMTELATLCDLGYTHWKLDGIYTPGDTFVKIAERFIQAKKLLEAGGLTPIQAFVLDEEIRSLHPTGRTLGHGFYDLDPDEIK